MVTIPGHPGDDVPVGTMESILRTAGLEEKKMSAKYAVIFERAENNWAAYVPDPHDYRDDPRSTEIQFLSQRV